MSTPPSIEDLSVLARRRPLTLPESRRLELALKSSEDAELLHRSGCDFDALDTARPGDAELVQRLAERAVESFAISGSPGGRASRRRRRAGQFGFAVLSASLFAAGAWGVKESGLVERLTARPSVAPAPARGTAAPRTLDDSRAAPAAKEAPTPAGTTTNEAHPSETSSVADARREGRLADARGERRPARMKPATAAPPADAAALFAQANSERKAGNVTRALAFYSDLQRRYPSTPEARLSHLITGQLRLRSGDFGSALEHFDRYLAFGRSGALVEEALQGRAQALRALGRSQEEEKTLRELVERFPDSIQARAARNRLAPPP